MGDFWCDNRAMAEKIERIVVKELTYEVRSKSSKLMFYITHLWLAKFTLNLGQK